MCSPGPSHYNSYSWVIQSVRQSVSVSYSKLEKQFECKWSTTHASDGHAKVEIQLGPISGWTEE